MNRQLVCLSFFLLSASLSPSWSDLVEDISSRSQTDDDGSDDDGGGSSDNQKPDSKPCSHAQISKCELMCCKKIRTQFKVPICSLMCETIPDPCEYMKDGAFAGHATPAKMLCNCLSENCHSSRYELSPSTKQQTCSGSMIRKPYPETGYLQFPKITSVNACAKKCNKSPDCKAFSLAQTPSASSSANLDQACSLYEAVDQKKHFTDSAIKSMVCGIKHTDTCIACKQPGRAKATKHWTGVEDTAKSVADAILDHVKLTKREISKGKTLESQACTNEVNATCPKTSGDKCLQCLRKKGGSDVPAKCTPTTVLKACGITLKHECQAKFSHYNCTKFDKPRDCARCLARFDVHSALGIAGCPMKRLHQICKLKLHAASPLVYDETHHS
jgi:hypothetical protein